MEFVWIAGDPERDRAALVTRSAVEIVPQGGTVAEDSQGRAATCRRAEPAAEARSEARVRAATQDPNASAARALGRAEGGGLRSGRRRSSSPMAAGRSPASARTPDGVLAARLRQHVRHRRRDRRPLRIEGPDRGRGRSGHCRRARACDGALAGLRAHPGQSLRVGAPVRRRVLSLEWDTDSVRPLPFGELAPAGRNRGWREARHDAQPARPGGGCEPRIAHHSTTKWSIARAAAERSGADCAAETRRAPTAAGDELLGDAARRRQYRDCRCAHAEATSRSMLPRRCAARRRARACGSWSRTTRSRACCRRRQPAMRTRPHPRRRAGAHRDRSAATSTRRRSRGCDAVRRQPSRDDPAGHRGGRADLRDSARIRRATRRGPDPAAHQLAAHATSADINDIEALAEALCEFSHCRTALPRHRTDRAEARFVAHRRAQLARCCPTSACSSIADGGRALDASTLP